MLVYCLKLYIVWNSEKNPFILLFTNPNFPPFLPNPTFPFYFHSQPPSIHDVFHDAVSQFNGMLLMRNTPSIIEFGKILGSLVKMKHFPTAISLSKQMEAKGIEPNLVTLSILINCFCHMGQMALSFSVLGKILRTLHVFKDSKSLINKSSMTTCH